MQRPLCERMLYPRLSMFGSGTVLYCSSVSRTHSGQQLRRRCQQMLLASCTNSPSCSSLCVFNGGSLLLFSCLMGFLLLNPSDEADPAVLGIIPSWWVMTWGLEPADLQAEREGCQRFLQLNLNWWTRIILAAGLMELASTSNLSQFLSSRWCFGSFSLTLSLFYYRKPLSTTRVSYHHNTKQLSLSGWYPVATHPCLYALLCKKLSLKMPPSSLLCHQNSIRASRPCSTDLLEETSFKSVYPTDGFFIPNSSQW